MANIDKKIVKREDLRFRVKSTWRFGSFKTCCANDFVLRGCTVHLTVYCTKYIAKF